MLRDAAVAFILMASLAACSREPEPPAQEGGARRALAAAGDMSADFDRCIGSGDAAMGVEPAMQDCYRDELGLQDKRLNQSWARVIAVLDEQATDSSRPSPEDALSPKSRADRVRTAQRDWLRYRDSKCESENQSGGQMDATGRLSCHVRETIRRTAELDSLAESLAQS